MAIWSQAPNVHVVPIEHYDAVPFMNAADLMISDLSSVLYEFAATGKPVIQADFLRYHWTKRGPLHYRRWQRVDRPILERFHSSAEHARRYRDLRKLVPQRLELAEALVGPLDGRSSERVCEFLLEQSGTTESKRGVSRTVAHS
jgi:CDP-glycerol glycerophosphotransferase (TagB/SpsB family)